MRTRPFKTWGKSGIREYVSKSWKNPNKNNGASNRGDVVLDYGTLILTVYTFGVASLDE